MADFVSLFTLQSSMKRCNIPRYCKEYIGYVYEKAAVEHEQVTWDLACGDKSKNGEKLSKRQQRVMVPWPSSPLWSHIKSALLLSIYALFLHPEFLFFKPTPILILLLMFIYATQE